MKSLKLLIVLSIILVSCGEGESADCSCKEIAEKNDGLYYKTGMIKDGDRVKFGELFSGACEERNADDKRVKYMVVKNGYLKKKKKWADIFGELKLVVDLEYGFGIKMVSFTEGKDSAIPKNGFTRKITINKESQIAYVSYYTEYENEKIKNKWKKNRKQMEDETYILVMYEDFEDVSGNPFNHDRRCEVPVDGVLNLDLTTETLKSMLKCMEQESDKFPGFWHNADLSNAESLSTENTEASNQDKQKLSSSEQTEVEEETSIDEKNKMESTNIELFMINDPDGYSNLRKTPGGEIIKKVYENEHFEVIGEKANHQEVKLKDGTIGFIHNSRVVKV